MGKFEALRTDETEAGQSICPVVSRSELRPAEPLWTLVDEPIVEKHIANLDDLETIIGQRCVHRDLARDAIKSCAKFNWWSISAKPV